MLSLDSSIDPRKLAAIANCNAIPCVEALAALSQNALTEPRLLLAALEVASLATRGLNDRQLQAREAEQYLSFTLEIFKVLSTSAVETWLREVRPSDSAYMAERDFYVLNSRFPSSKSAQLCAQFASEIESKGGKYPDAVEEIKQLLMPEKAGFSFAKFFGIRI